MKPSIILIHPPVVKPSEPPPGIGRLSACLTTHGIAHDVIDANLEGLHFLLSSTAGLDDPAGSRWDLRARKHVEVNLAALGDIATYQHPGRYSRAVRDVGRVLTLAGAPFNASLTPADYTSQRLTPVRLSDLHHAARHPEENPFYTYFRLRMESALAESPEWIGLSINFLSQALCAMSLAGLIRILNPRQKIVIGGSLITSWLRLTRNPDLFEGLVDQAVEGAGEEKLLSLLKVSGRREGPSTDYSLTAQGRYWSPGFVLPYSAASGCWWRSCAFCPEKAEGHPYLPQPVSKVTSELQRLVEQTRPSLIHLLDSALSPALFAGLIRTPPGAPWYGFARITKELTDEDFCRALKASGCVMLKLGIESGSPAVLNALNKGIELSCASAALQTLNKAGIATYGYFLFGTPPETEAAAHDTLAFVCRHGAYIDFLNLAIFNLPLASPEAQTLSTGAFYEGDLSLYSNFRHPLGWHRQNVRAFLQKTFRKHPAIAPMVRRSPEFFTSNHAPFFTF